MKHEPVVEFVPGQEDEIIDGLGSVLGEQFANNLLYLVLRPLVQALSPLLDCCVLDSDDMVAAFQGALKNEN